VSSVDIAAADSTLSEFDTLTVLEIDVPAARDTPLGFGVGSMRAHCPDHGIGVANRDICRGMRTRRVLRCNNVAQKSGSMSWEAREAGREVVATF